MLMFLFSITSIISTLPPAWLTACHYKDIVTRALCYVGIYHKPKELNPYPPKVMSKAKTALSRSKARTRQGPDVKSVTYQRTRSLCKLVTANKTHMTSVFLWAAIFHQEGSIPNHLSYLYPLLLIWKCSKRFVNILLIGVVIGKYTIHKIMRYGKNIYSSSLHNKC